MSQWVPSANLQTLKQRAKILERVRHFFSSRGVLEVDTPLMCRATVTDPHIISIPTQFKELGTSKTETLYLQTSPEYAMKRLLAAGCGAIYQICKAFRQGEVGKKHNPEFTMLEWYRPGFDHHALMNEMDELLQYVIQVKAAERLSYAEMFIKYVGINPHTASMDEFAAYVKQNNIAVPVMDSDDRNYWLDILLTHCIEPHLGKDAPVFVYDFPVTQAALAKIRNEENPPVASRFEVYFKGVELANGFHELQDAKEQRKRFENDLKLREVFHVEAVPIDENFLAALNHGLPDCAGVALGIDRLVMLAAQAKTVKDVISFSFEKV